MFLAVMQESVHQSPVFDCGTKSAAGQTEARVESRGERRQETGERGGGGGGGSVGYL